MIQEIQKLDDYIEVMNKIEFFIQKATANGGVDTLPKEEFDTLNDLSLMANAYEKNARTNFLSQPKSISDAVKIKMMHLRLKQKDMAALLGIAESRLSEVLSGKRKVNMELAKKLNRILKIEAEFILQAA
jgi:HTH-type transcriptional regulator/antitoxin HigA